MMRRVSPASRAILALAAAFSVAACAPQSVTSPTVASDNSYAQLTPEEMHEQAKIVVDVDAAPVETERKAQFPSHRMTVDDEGSASAELNEATVYEVTVAWVRKGDQVAAGDRILVAPMPDQDASGGGAARLPAGAMTLYLTELAGEAEVWTTLSPAQGAEPRQRD